MKIVYLENVRVPSERAHAYQIVQTCAWLARAGHDVMLVNPDRAVGKDVFSWFGIEQHLFKHVLIKAWDPLSTSFPLKALTYALQRWSFTRAVRKWAKNVKADVWYTRDAAMIDALRGAVSGPWILESHDTPDTDAARWARVKPLIKAHVAISQGMKDRLIELGVGSEQVLVAHDGYDPKEFEQLLSRDEARQSLGLPNDAFVALYAGSFYPWKGIDLVIQSWDQTPSSHHLVLIGGPERESVRVSALIPASAKDRVHLLPVRPRQEVIRLFSAADVGLITSSPQFEIARRYTSPLKLFEYLAAGVPILASDVPSSHEVLDQTSARFFRHLPESFLAVLKEVGPDPSWKQQALSDRAVVQQYTWQARSQHIADFIQHYL